MAAYYLYGHYLNGALFYVGYGNMYRPHNMHNRSKEWLDYVGGREVVVKIFAEFDDSGHARRAEEEMIHQHYKGLVNRSAPSAWLRPPRGYLPA